MVERLFLKIDRIRRLRAATSITACVRRGPDGSFGLGLSDDNALLELHHDENKHALRTGAVDKAGSTLLQGFAIDAASELSAVDGGRPAGSLASAARVLSAGRPGLPRTRDQ